MQAIQKYIQGIDVSRWQGSNINFKKVKAANYQFAFVKVTDGSAYKQQFIEICKLQATQAKAAGLKIGYYHYAHPSNFNGLEKDAQEEANYFLKTLKSFPQPNFPLVLDFEDPKSTLTQSESEKWILEFKRVINKAGYELILYSYTPYLNQYLPAKHQLAIMSLWVAAYPTQFNIAKPPKLPKGFKSWVMWQYSDKGQVSGIANAKVDLNIMPQEFFLKYK